MFFDVPDHLQPKNFLCLLRLVNVEAPSNPQPYIPKDDWRRMRKTYCYSPSVPITKHVGATGTRRLAAMWPKKYLQRLGNSSYSMGGRPGHRYYFQVDIYFNCDEENRWLGCIYITGPEFKLVALSDIDKWNASGLELGSPILTTNRDLDMGKLPCTPVHSSPVFLKATFLRTLLTSHMSHLVCRPEDLHFLTFANHHQVFDISNVEVSEQWEASPSPSFAQPFVPPNTVDSSCDESHPEPQYAAAVVEYPEGVPTSHTKIIVENHPTRLKWLDRWRREVKRKS